MTETGRVTRIDEDRVTLLLEKDLGCESCGSGNAKKEAGSCHVCVPLGATRDRRTLTAINRRQLELKIGDRVEVAFDPRKAVFAQFLFFIFPLILFLGAFGILSAVFPQLPEPLRVLLSLGGFALACLAIILLRVIRKTKDWPEVVARCGNPSG